MVLKGLDDKDDGRGNEQLDNLTTSGSGAQTENDGRKEEQKKAREWLNIGLALVILAAFLFLVLISAFITSATLMVVLIAVVAALILVWNVVLGILAIPTAQAWIIESKGIFLRIAVKSPTILPLRGFITHIAAKISMKEIFEEDIFGGKKLRVKNTLIGVQVAVGYKVEDFYRFYYSVESAKGKTWGQTMKDLIQKTARDALQTHVTAGDLDIDTVVKIKGPDLADEIFRGSGKEYDKIKGNLKEWGIKITTLIFGDFEESDADMELKKKVLEAEQAKIIAEIGIETGRMLGKATAENIKAATWELAKDYAGVRKEDKDLTTQEIQAIAKFVPLARSDYLESLSIAAIKPTDKTIVTPATMIEPIGEAATREAIRLGMSKEQRELKKGGKEEEKKEQKKED